MRVQDRQGRPCLNRQLEHSFVNEETFSQRDWLWLCTQEAQPMLGWAVTFFILALIAGLLGFFALAGLAAEIAKVLLFVFLIIFLISAISNAMRGRAPPV